MDCLRGNVVALVAFVWLFSSQTHTGCICLTFPRYVFSNVFSNGQPERMQSHTGCICSAFLHCGFLNVSSKRLDNRMQSHIACICSTFLHCAFSNVASNCFTLLELKHLEFRLQPPLQAPSAAQICQIFHLDAPDCLTHLIILLPPRLFRIFLDMSDIFTDMSDISPVYVSECPRCFTSQFLTWYKSV